MRALPSAAQAFIVARDRRRARPCSRGRCRSSGLDTPYLFLALLVLSNVTSAFKVALLSASGSTMSVSYAIDFAALLLLGPNPTTIIAVSSAWSQCTFRMKQPTPLYRTLFSMASLAITVRAAGWVYERLGGAPGVHADSFTVAAALVGAATTYFLFNTVLVSAAIALSTRQPLSPPWNQNFLWSAPSYFVGAAVAFVAGWAMLNVGIWLGLLLARADLSHLPHLQGLSRPHRRRTAPRAGDVRPAPGHDRSARARHRREGSDGAEPHPPRAGLCRGPGQGARHAGAGDPGREDGGPAARHRQAGGARAHPVEARTAHAGRVPEDPHPPAGGRRDHQRRAVPVSRGSAHPEPPRALGRPRLSAGTEGRRHPARRAHPHRGRLLRRAHLRPPLPPGDGARGGAVAARPGVGQGARPESGEDVLRPAAGAGGRGRPARTGAHAASHARTHVGARPSGCGLRERERQEQHGLRRHRARAQGDLRALRNRAVDGHQPGRGRHHGAHQLEAEQPGAICRVCPLPLRRGARLAAVPLRDRSRFRADRPHDHQERPRADRLGHPQSPSARERPAERRFRGRGPGRHGHLAQVGDRLAAHLSTTA